MTVPPTPAPRERAPMFNVPPVIVASVVVLTALHLLRVSLPLAQQNWVIEEFAYVPLRLWAFLAPDFVAAQLTTRDSATLPEAQGLVRAFADEGLKPWTILTYALLHGGYNHLAMNALWLVAFGAPVARRFGPVRFLALLAVASIAGALAQTLTNPFQPAQLGAPIIGASAAVSGAVGSAVRFVFQPGESLGPARSEDERDEATHGAPIPPLPLRALAGNRQVVTFLIIWFVVNFVFGVLAQPLGITEQAIAWEAHIGGFLAGLLLFQLFDPRRARQNA